MMSNDVEVDDDALQKFLGTSSFGKQDRQNESAQGTTQNKKDQKSAKAVGVREDEDGDEEDDDRKSDAQGGSADSDSDSNSDSDSDSDSDDGPEYPTTQILRIPTHSRAVTTSSLDPSGARLITGSLDGTLKFHDLQSITPTTIRAFKSVDPSNTRPSAAANNESHPIASVAFNPLSPSTVLVVDASAQPKLLSRDGELISEFVKGDMYLRDMNNTKGHISQVTGGVWHPTNRQICVTAGTDSTLRIWDIENTRQQKEVLVVKSRQAGSAGRTRLTAMSWGSQSSETGIQSCLVATALDGTMVMYGGDGPHYRPTIEIKNAHTPDTWTSGVDISPDGRLVVTRGGDDTIKVWDIRKFKIPINTTKHESTSSQYPTSNIQFGPNGTSIITGSVDGSLYILNPATLQPDQIRPVTPSSPLISVLWHPKLNQIITGSANAETNILWDTDLSTGGAKTIMSRAPKRRHFDDDPTLTTDVNSQILSSDAIILPGGSTVKSSSFATRHPNVGLTVSGKSRDPRRPYQPSTTPFSKSNPDTDYVKTQIPLSGMRNEDPREALLKYADIAKREPLFTHAWSETQPETIYSKLDVDDGQQEDGEKKGVKRVKR